MDNDNEATDGLPTAAPRASLVRAADKPEATVGQTAHRRQGDGGADDNDDDSDDDGRQRRPQQPQQAPVIEPRASGNPTNADDIDQIVRICHSIISRHSADGLTDDDELSTLLQYMPAARMHKTIHMTLFTAQKAKYLKLRAYHQRRIKQLTDEVIKSERLIEKLKRSWRN